MDSNIKPKKIYELYIYYLHKQSICASTNAINEVANNVGIDKSEVKSKLKQFLKYKANRVKK